MINLIKKIVPTRMKPFLNKFRMPIKYIDYSLNKKQYLKNMKAMNIKFYTDEETVNEITKNNKSLSRFGDGEFLWLLNIKTETYQVASEKLSKRLKEVLTSDNDNLIIGLPNVMDEVNLNKYMLHSRIHWVNFMDKYFKYIKPLINLNKIYADTQISRCYIDYKDKSKSGARYNNLKRIWNNKDLLIVEGEKTKLGVGNDLLNNSNKIERIICPAKNAFDKYDEILECVKKHGKNKIILLALGPTATILAYDLSKLDGYIAVDLGHIDIEYEWFLRGVKKRKAIPGKFVNEVRTKDLSNEESNNEDYELYKKTIIKEIL